MKSIDRLKEELKSPEKALKIKALKSAQKMGATAASLFSSIAYLLTDKSGSYVRSQAAVTLFLVTGDSVVGIGDLVFALSKETDDATKEAFSFVLAEKFRASWSLPPSHILAKKLLVYADKLPPVCKKHLCYGLAPFGRGIARKFIKDCLTSPIPAVRSVAQKAIDFAKELGIKKREEKKLEKIKQPSAI